MPVVLVLPWDALCPDNRRLGVLKGRALLSRRYRAAKALATRELAAQYAPRAPFAGAVRLDVALWLPDLRRRDTVNVGKLLGDALEGAGVLGDDFQIADARLWRAGIDRTEPRAVLTLSPVEGA